MSRVASSSMKALVVAPFFYTDQNANRPLSAACVLSEFAEVDVYTTGFSHATKIRREESQLPNLARIVYVKTPEYRDNVGLGRLISHLMFSLRVIWLLRHDLSKYNIVYSTLPFNCLAWHLLRRSRAKYKIVDITDIWPDVLPFSNQARRILAPVFRAWKWFFKASVWHADLVMAVSDAFLTSARPYARPDALLKRVYIGHEPLQAEVEKRPLKTIAYVGSIGRLYDFDTLMQVLCEPEFRECFQLLIIGKGDRQEWLMKELKERGICHHFYGPIFDTQKLAVILRGCHIGFNGYCNTTAAFSYKANTYFAAGLPILNSMPGDLQRLVEQRHLGYNYVGGDVVTLRRAIKAINEDSMTKLAVNSREFFAAELDRSKVRRDLHECVASLLNKSAGTQ